MTTSPEVTSLLQLYGRDMAIKEAIKATDKLRLAIKQKDDLEPLSPKAQLLKEKCISFGPSGPKWASIIGILIEENITIKDPNAKYPFIIMAAISPIVIESSPKHNYSVGGILFMATCDGPHDVPRSIKGIRADGLFGNNIVPFIKNCEIPTDTRIIKTLNKIFDTVGDIIIDW